MVQKLFTVTMICATALTIVGCGDLRPTPEGAILEGQRNSIDDHSSYWGSIGPVVIPVISKSPNK